MSSAAPTYRPTIEALQRELHRLFERNLAGIGQASLEGQILRCNPALARILGADRPELLIGQLTSQFYAEPQHRQALVAQLRLEGSLNEVEIQIRRRNGELRWVLANAQLVPSDTGDEPVIEGTLIDITDRKRTEQALRDKDEHLQILLEQMPAALWTTDTNLRFTSVSGATHNATGRLPNALLGVALEDVIQNASDVALIRDMHRRALRGERVSYEVRFPPHSYQCHLEPLRDAAEQIVGTVGIALENTENVLAREELARSNAELQQFAYAASHDLQEPLRTVTSFTQLLADRLQPRLNPEENELIGFVVDGTARMQVLLADLSAYSRVSTHHRDPVPVDCNQVLARVRCNLHLALEESATRLEVEPLPVVLADPSQLDQVFQNLIGNAIKFRSARTPEVHVMAKQVGVEWRFTVRDNGIGLEPQYSDRIFRIFQRLHPRTEYPGTGIGLAICQRIVERHGGRIWVEARAGEGATFYFTLPAAPAATAISASKQLDSAPGRLPTT